MTPILGILVAIGCGLALVAVAIIVVLRIRPSSVYSTSSRHKANTTVNAGTLYGAGTHVPLNQREIDELMGPGQHEEKEPDLIPQNRGNAHFVSRVGLFSSV